MHDKVLTELAKLIKVPNLHKILEKNATGLKWKMIKMVFKRRKNDSRFVEEKSIILEAPLEVVDGIIVQSKFFEHKKI